MARPKIKRQRKKPVKRKTATKKRVRRVSPKVLKIVKRQTGKTNTKADKKRTALKPGLRLSKNKKKYWETRRNRSDRNKHTKL